MRFNFRFSVLIILSILSVSCQDYYSRKSHKRTTELQKELFVETFTIFGSGAYGTDVVTQYLTDSIEFRKYIGTFDEGNEFYYYNISGDTVNVEKYKVGMNGKGKTLLKREQLLISSLKKQIISNNLVLLENIYDK